MNTGSAVLNGKFQSSYTTDGGTTWSAWADMGPESTGEFALAGEPGYIDVEQATISAVQGRTYRVALLLRKQGSGSVGTVTGSFGANT